MNNNSSIEEIMEELDGIAKELDSPFTKLDVALNKYKLATDLILKCYSKLNHAENEIKILDQKMNELRLASEEDLRELSHE